MIRTRSTALIGLAVLLAGCGTAEVRGTTTSADQHTPLTLATSAVTTAGTWAVTVVGGKVSEHNNFWQLLVRPAGSATWKLVTPPGVASNGGLVIAPLKGDALVTAFRPSQDLRFTPLASTADTGRSWSSGLIDADVADTPSALASDPATGAMLALLADGSVEQGSAGSQWSRIGTITKLNDANPHCALSQVTAVALTVSGTPLAAGNCTERGVAGIFAHEGKSWLLSGPSVPKALRGDQVSVLALTTSLALLQAGTGTGASVLVAAEGASGWLVSAPEALGGASVSAFATGSGGQIGLVLTSGRGLLLSGTGSSWQVLPRLPALTQTLAFGQGTDVQALVPGRTSVAFFDYQKAPGTWTLAQKLKVPVQFGSSS